MKPLFELTKEVNPENLKDAIQQAINLEIATIPTYLYTYYSIQRSWNQEGEGKGSVAQLRSQITNDINHEHHTASEEEIEKMVLDIQVYSNKAAALIMTVVIEEMLHMALTSNVKQAIFGPPELYGKNSIPDFPAALPGHEPAFPINLAPFSLEQLVTFLRIESPVPIPKDVLAPGGKADKVDYQTIGGFYKLLEKCVKDHFSGPYQTERPQLVPGKSFYAQNTINTTYYDKEHKPKFANADDSGDLIHVVDSDSALKAMEEVVEQGEGSSSSGTVWNSDGTINTEGLNFDDPSSIPSELYDDPDKKELSHFAKFLELYCEGQKFKEQFSEYGLEFESYFVHNIPSNPKTKTNYEGRPEYQAVSDLINGLYSYLFLMVESCYHKSGNTQYEIFMFGVHKTMIWALSTLCNTVTGWSYKEGTNELQMAPTFEFYEFNKETSPKEQLQQLVAMCPDKSKVTWESDYQEVNWVSDYVDNLPDISLDFEVASVV